MHKKILICILFIFIVFMLNNVYAVSYQNGIESFPESYKGYLIELKNKHPNWEFTAIYTDLDWNNVINNENVFGKNLVPKSYSDRWKNTNPGQYNVEVDGDWVDCSRQAIEFAMDPRNFLNEIRIFQFEKLSYDSNTNTKEAIEKILYGTEFYNNKVNYLDANGNTIYTNFLYSDLILNASRESRSKRISFSIAY